MKLSLARFHTENYKMHQDFPQSMPVYEQLLKISYAKQPGRKHQHRPGIKAKQRVKNTEFKNKKFNQIKFDRYHLEVKKYWNGKRDTYPNK